MYLNYVEYLMCLDKYARVNAHIFIHMYNYIVYICIEYMYIIHMYSYIV